MLRPNRRSHTFGVPKSKKAPLPHPQALTSQVESYWLPRLHTRGVARAMAMGKEKVQWWFIAIPFSSGCRSHSSVDVVHASKESQGVWLRAQSKVSFLYSMHLDVSCTEAWSKLSPAAAGKGKLLVAWLLRGFKNLSQKGDTVYSALRRIFT
jgi:hypothetical protein